MSIKDIISRKPRWQHEDPLVRIEAIDAISDQDILSQLIADDPEEKVKCAAINQLLDSQELSRLAKLPGDLGNTARAQFCRILEQNENPLPGLSLIRSIDQVELLKDVAMSSTSPDITLLALEKLNDEALLVDIACAAATTQVRESAAQKVQSAESLDLLQKRARHKDKLVHNIAKTRLQEMQAQSRLKQQHFDDADAIISELRQLPPAANQTTLNRMLSHLQTKWEALQPGFEALPDENDKVRIAQLREAFAETTQQCLHQIQSLQRERDAEAETLTSAKLISAQLEAVLGAARDGSNSLAEQQQSYDSLNSQWHSLAHLSLPLEVKETYYSLTSKLEFLLDAHKRWGEIKAQLASVQGSNSNGETSGKAVHTPPPKLIEKLMNFHWPEDFPAPDDLTETRESIRNRLAENAEQADARKKHRAEIQEKLDKVEQEVKAGHLSAATKLKRQVTHLINDLDDHQLNDRLQKISAKITELRDWQGFATRPKREELCNKMEALAGLTLHPTDKAARIKELHAEWKGLGDSHSDQKHWHRFKQASDAAYEPCKIYFEQQSNERAQRLQERLKICEQLEEFDANMDWESVNWKGLVEIITTARKQWRDLGPLDHAQRKRVQTRFYKAIDALNTHLTTEQNRNQELKKKLIEQVTSQLEEETDLHQAIKATIELQKQWKQVGVMDRKVDQKLWKKFRRACDAVFNRRDEQKKAEREAEAQRLTQAEAFCQSVEELAKAPLQEVKPSKAKLAQLQAEFKSIELSHGLRNKIERRFSTACENYQRQIGAYARQKELGSIEELSRRAGICALLERQIETGECTDDAGLDARWNAEQELPKAIEQRINERWQNAKQLITQPLQTREQIMTENAVAGRLICIRMEILAELESPDHDQQVRMSYQVDRLKKELSMGEKETRSLAEQFRALQEDWCCLGPIPAAQFDELSPRIQTAQKKFIGS